MDQKLPSKGFIRFVLLVQFIPLILFPPQSFSPDSQEWWLPALLALMVIFADVELLARRGTTTWPWNLMSFAQGFNIISRLMLLWPHATVISSGATGLNVPYILLTLLAIILSTALLLYVERPGVRMGLTNA